MTLARGERRILETDLWSSEHPFTACIGCGLYTPGEWPELVHSYCTVHIGNMATVVEGSKELYKIVLFKKMF